MMRLETTSLEAIIDSVRSVVDAVIASPPATKLDLKRRLADELGVDPDPETLHAFARIADIEDPGGRGLVASAIETRLAAQLTLDAVWGPAGFDPDALARSAACLPVIEDLIRREDRIFADTIDAVSRLERDVVRKLRDPIRVDLDPIRAARVLVPEIVVVAGACRDGRLETVAAGLGADEIEVITAVVGRVEPRPDRTVADAVVLRRHIAKLTAKLGADGCDSGHDHRAAVNAPRDAYRFVSARLDEARSACFAELHRTDPILDETRRRLFATYLDLNKLLTGGTEPVEPDSVAARILEAEEAGAAIDAKREETQALMRDAASKDESRVEAILPPDAQGLARERRRRKILVGVAVGLVPVAVATNLVLHPWGKHATGFDGSAFESTLPLREVAPLPERVYTEVSSSLWSTLSDAEKRAKAGELGAVAEKQGFRALVVVDEDRRELATWSAARGSELVEDGRSGGSVAGSIP